MTKMICTLITDLRHLNGLIDELEAAGFAVDVCPDELKPTNIPDDERRTSEFVEVSRDVPDAPNTEQLDDALIAMNQELFVICERHDAFADESEEAPADHDPHIHNSPTWQKWRRIEAKLN